jgi:hypothetical protein
MLFDEQLAAVQMDYPQVVEEYERLRQWVAVCIGAHVAAVGGPSV